MIELNKIYNEPCLETVKRMPDNYLDCVITSPPYWQLRDYGYPEQWGLEPTFNEYLEHLWELMDEIYRVLKPTGTCWVNLGDTYARLDKCLLLIPHRFAIGCIDRGWIVRNDIVWAKRNGMPESVTDRFSKKHEYFFFMTKSTNYYFDLDSVRDRAKVDTPKKYYDLDGSGISKDLVGQRISKDKPAQYAVIDKEFRNLVVEVRDLPDHNELRAYLSKARKSSGHTIQEIEDYFGTQAPHHWFEKNGSYPSVDDWVKLKELLKFDETYDKQITEVELKSGLKENNPKGKNCGDVSDFWDIPTKPSSNEHYAAYNDELIKKPILAGCPEGGIIYDPFMGTGSTAESALRANRKFIGSEMSEKYIDIANKRLHQYLSQSTLF